MTIRKNQNVKSKLISNSLFMMILQAMQLLVPLLLMPFIIKKFGIEAFGLLSFATAICMFINVVCDYGFNLTATRAIAVNVDNPSAISDIFNATLGAKSILLVVAAIIYGAVVFFIDELHDDWLIYFLSFGLVIGNVLFPLWLYQGFQNFKFITILNIILKIAFTASIFVMADNKDDLYIVPLFISLGFIVPAIIAFVYALIKYQIKLGFPSALALKDSFKESWHIFISRLAVFSYTSINIVFLGFFTTTTVVGYYAVASRVIGAVSSVISMINQVLFPYLSNVWEKNNVIYFKKLQFFSVGITVTMTVIAMGIIITSPFIVFIITGSKNEMSILVMQLLSFALILMPLGGLFTQSFVTQRKNSLVTAVTLRMTGLNFLLIFILTPLYGAYGMAIAICLVQVYQVILNLLYLSKLKDSNTCAV